MSVQPRGCSQGTPENPALPPRRCPLPGRETLKTGRGMAISHAHKGAAAPWGASTQHQAMAADPCGAARRPDATWVALRGSCQHPPRCQPRFPTHHQHRGLLARGLLSRGTWGGCRPVQETRLGGSGDEHHRAGVAASRGTWQLFEEACATATVVFARTNLVTAE